MPPIRIPQYVPVRSRMLSGIGRLSGCVGANLPCSRIERTQRFRALSKHSTRCGRAALQHAAGNSALGEHQAMFLFTAASEESPPQKTDPRCCVLTAKPRAARPRALTGRTTTRTVARALWLAEAVAKEAADAPASTSPPSRKIAVTTVTSLLICSPSGAAAR